VPLKSPTKKAAAAAKMRLRYARRTNASAEGGEVRRPLKLPVRETVAGRLRLAAIARRNMRRAQSARMSWYDPREVYWTLAAECPEWADEMRRVERYRRWRKGRY
jgi:hypothetical protein